MALTAVERSIEGLKVLVVDDTATNRLLLQAFLKKLGCEVFLAEDGARAVEVFPVVKPDLVLMDVMMPVMDGYEATRRIKALSASRWIPVVFVSALDKDENLVAGLEAGGDDYLAKPVNFVVLSAKLRSLSRTLDLQRRLDENRRRTEAITNNIADSVITIDDQGRILSANAVAPIAFGYEIGELLGQNISMLMPEPDRSAHDGYIQNYLRGGMPQVIGIAQRQVAGQHKDGSLLPLELTVTEMRFEGSRMFVGILRDIRERLAAEHEVREHGRALQRYHDEQESETLLASGIMQRLMLRPGLADPRVHQWLMPASDFSGDVIAAARTSDGRLCALLADATGHGLAASISALPVLTTFYSLVEQDFALDFIAHEVNRQLMAFMPTERFVAASLVCFSEADRMAAVWVGGMPDVLQLGADGSVSHCFKSTNLALGIVAFAEDGAGIERVGCPPGSQLVLMSDGVLEAANAAGEPFGIARMRKALQSAPANRRLDVVREALHEHLGGSVPHDDISLLLIDC
jgi:two-component system, HptB-dependent secretion and biofilm response regulator